MTSSEIRAIQSQLSRLGFDPGPVDGVMGPHTQSAIVAFKRSRGLRPRPYIGPLTMRALFVGATHRAARKDHLPWIAEGRRLLGLHEVRDNGWLRKWLASDGHALGDPARFPWCGDFIETSIRLALPDEPIPQNPYWALNWRQFGVSTVPTYGCVASIKRAGGGHVMFIVGQDGSRYYALGGNQGNTVSIAPVDKSRFVPESFRWPESFPKRAITMPYLTSAAASNAQES